MSESIERAEEAYQRLQITMPNEKVAQLDRERGDVPRSTYLASLVGNESQQGRKKIYLPMYASINDDTALLSNDPYWHLACTHDRWLWELLPKETRSAISAEYPCILLNGSQQRLLTTKLLDRAEKRKNDYELWYHTNFLRDDLEQYLKKLELSEYMQWLSEINSITYDLRGCIIHLRLLGVDEDIIEDLEHDVYNDACYSQSRLIKILCYKIDKSHP